MVGSQILTINFPLSGEGVENLPYYSNRSLLDADIIVIRLVFPDDPQHQPSGKLEKAFAHWSSEFQQALQVGKVVFAFLTEPTIYTNPSTKKIYNSYDILPVRFHMAIKSGKGIILADKNKLLTGYWKNFQASTSYKVQLSQIEGEPLLKTSDGDILLGVQISYAAGKLFLLPNLTFDSKWLSTYDYVDGDLVAKTWSDDGVEFGKRLIGSLKEITRTVQRGRDQTPPPVWVDDKAYVLDKEVVIKDSISKLEHEINENLKKKAAQESELIKVQATRRLLYATGHDLEDAILDALRVLGFTADNYKDAISEFDAIFASVEGRFLGEAEGKDNAPVNVDKVRQLKLNLDEDFEREDVEKYAKGVLFSNAFRLTDLSKRGEFFTSKAKTSAKTADIALVRTPDLFFIAKYLIENPDPEYAQICRAAIATSKGEEVEFPVIPVKDQQ